MSRSSCLGVELESQSTIDAAMGLTIVQVDVHLWVSKSTTATIATNLGKQTMFVNGVAILISFVSIFLCIDKRAIIRDAGRMCRK